MKRKAIVVVLLLLAFSFSLFAADNSGAKLLREVKTVRNYTGESVQSEDIVRILEAGVNTQSGMNKQPWHFTAVTDKDVLSEINGEVAAMLPPGFVMTTTIKDAALLVVISGELGTEFDAGLACQNMVAEAQLLGYGTWIMTSTAAAMNRRDPAYYKTLLGVPESQTFMGVIIIGVEDKVDATSSASVRNAFDSVTTIL